MKACYDCKKDRENDLDGPVLENAVLDARCSPTISNVVALGAGCFWGTEKFCTRSKKFVSACLIIYIILRNTYPKNTLQTFRTASPKASRELGLDLWRHHQRELGGRNKSRFYWLS